jgi:HSP20 family protein
MLKNKITTHYLLSFIILLSPISVLAEKNTDFNPLFNQESFFWDPFKEFEASHQKMLEMMKNMKQNFQESSSFYNPQLSLEQLDKSYLVEVDLPGLEKDSINVEIENNLLTISGQRASNKESNTSNGFYQSERSFGAFKRSISLPKDALDENINADYKEGVLKITIPRKPENQVESKKQIKIN